MRSVLFSETSLANRIYKGALQALRRNAGKKSPRLMNLGDEIAKGFMENMIRNAQADEDELQEILRQQRQNPPRKPKSLLLQRFSREITAEFRENLVRQAREANRELRLLRPPQVLPPR